MSQSDIRVLPITSEEERGKWDDLAARSEVGHMHQCLWWAEPLSQFKINSHVLACWDKSRMVGGALFRVLPVPLTKITVMECLDGPIFLDWRAEWADRFVSAMKALGDEKRSMIVALKGCGDPEIHRDLVAAFGRAGLNATVTQGEVQAVLPLVGQTMASIRTRFRKGTKWSVKKGLDGPARISHLVSDAELRGAYAAWTATARRKGFLDVRPWPALQPVLRHCVDTGIGTVLGTSMNGRVLAAAFITFIGKTASWVYGGYVDGAEPYHPTHVLQWEALQDALKRGLTAYSFGYLSSAGEAGKSGVDDFKLGFGALPRRNLDTITWERRPLLNRCIQSLRRQGVGRRIEKLVRSRLLGRAGRQEAF